LSGTYDADSSFFKLRSWIEPEESYMKRRRQSMLLLPALCAGLVLAGCGGSDEADSDFTPASAGPVEAVAGCENGWTDPADLAPDREPARCETDAPAPRPLPERASIVVTAATPNAEFIAPIRWAIENGEFDKENLDVQLRQVPSADGLSLLAQGDSDALVGSPDAAFYNAVSGGFGLRWVMGNFSPPEEGGSGLWARDVAGRPATVEDLRGKTLASVLGTGSPIMYPLQAAFEEADMSISDVSFQTLPAADVVTSLLNGGLDAAWVLDPLWLQLEEKPGLSLLSGPVLGEPIGGVLFGPNLLGDRRDAGEAFTRAVVRTINTSFAGDYKSDPTFVEELAGVIELPVEQLEQTPSLVMDWEIRSGTEQRVQEALINVGTLSYAEPLPEAEVVDRSFYEQAVGHGQ
jgi:NitT/TauT family transport system substrate-binding protein